MAETRRLSPLVRGVVLVTFGSGIASLATPACYGRQCEGDVQFYGKGPGQGDMLDPDTWESTPLDGTWLTYSHERTWFLSMPGLGNRQPDWMIGYIASDPTPNVISPAGIVSNFTVGGGNLVEFQRATGPIGTEPPGVWVHNDTCADYYLRVVVHAAPFGADAGADADASGDAMDASDAADAADANDGGSE